MNDFAGSAAVFAAAFGTTPPSEVYHLHPAHDALADAIKAAVWRQFRGAKRLLDTWAPEQAAHILRDIVMSQGGVTCGGATADELKDDLADLVDPLPGSSGVIRALDGIAAALVDNTPPSHCSRLLAAWQAVRDCPPPDINLMRDDAPEWGSDWGHKNAG